MKLLISFSCAGILFAVAVSAHANSGQETGLYHSKSSEALACSDMAAVPEASDYILHDPANPNLLKIMTQGGCSPISPTVKFDVIKRYTWQIPAGPQQLVQVSIPMINNPSMPHDIEWMMQSDVVPAK
ncbi:hypothetical protein QN366_01635 [Pseudomonas sp. CCC3.2]|uniref:hypothetical protein n=1 Tax=unclassified Pseudomonas TaxID=196821 RepID=UPI002AB44CCD|nr:MULTISPECIES: hypothetical protein [unclassified Pseudomonas]MDY7560223.1 hypothetical protein [Pseudomonas sp. AB6]MEB0178772.1 hypothetical protein [Pseudomonas sp. CCC3.2]MEB0211410.1 hypothetical protein [Pseudomonas sp. AB6]